jgi:formiminoglutamase
MENLLPRFVHERTNRQEGQMLIAEPATRANDLAPFAEDPNWPRAQAWISGDSAKDAVGLLKILGVPLSRGSITPSRCDLAPKAIRRALRSFSTYDVRNERDVRALGIKDVGDLAVSELGVEEALTTIPAVASAVMNADAVVLLGGNNAITRAGVLSTALDLRRCGLVTLDAHLDLRDYEGGLHNGNPVRALLDDGLPGRNIVQIGIQSFSNSELYFNVACNAGIKVIPVEQIVAQGIEFTIDRALDQLANHVDSIYVDLDLDVLDRAYSPGTAGSRPGGLTPLEIRRAAYSCGSHPKVRVLDVVELDPTRDIHEMTALSAAACLLSFASGVLGRLTQPPTTSRCSPNQPSGEVSK